jgi:hypothetical protein
MSFLPQKEMNKSQNGVYSVAGGHFTATPTAGSKVVVLSAPGFTINARNVGSAFYWSDVAGLKTRHDIPIGNLSITGNSITFNDKDSNFDASDEVEVYLLGPDKVKAALDLIRSTDGIKKIVDSITEVNSADIKTILTAIRDTAGIKKITDDVEVVQPDAANLKNTEVNSATILARLTSILATVLADESAFTAGSSLGNLMLGAATSDEVDSNEVGAVKINTLRELIIAGYAALSNAIRVEEIDPLDLKYLPSNTELVNIASGTTGYVFFDMTGFSAIAFHGIVDTSATDSIIATLEATLLDDGTALADIPDTHWFDVTSIYNAGTTQFVKTNFSTIIENAPVKAFRWKYVTSGGTGDSDLEINAKQMF